MRHTGLTVINYSRSVLGVRPTEQPNTENAFSTERVGRARKLRPPSVNPKGASCSKAYIGVNRETVGLNTE